MTLAVQYFQLLTRHSTGLTHYNEPLLTYCNLHMLKEDSLFFFPTNHIICPNSNFQSLKLENLGVIFNLCLTWFFSICGDWLRLSLHLAFSVTHPFSVFILPFLSSRLLLCQDCFSSLYFLLLTSCLSTLFSIWLPDLCFFANAYFFSLLFSPEPLVPNLPVEGNIWIVWFDCLGSCHSLSTAQTILARLIFSLCLGYILPPNFMLLLLQ